MLKSRVAIILLAASLALPAVAQTVTGTILGLVTDPSGAVVPGATVTATNQSTGFMRSVNTDPEGNYRITFSQPRGFSNKACAGIAPDTSIRQDCLNFQEPLLTRDFLPTTRLLQ